MELQNCYSTEEMDTLSLPVVMQERLTGLGTRVLLEPPAKVRPLGLMYQATEVGSKRAQEFFLSEC